MTTVFPAVWDHKRRAQKRLTSGKISMFPFNYKIHPRVTGQNFHSLDCEREMMEKTIFLDSTILAFPTLSGVVFSMLCVCFMCPQNWYVYAQKAEIFLQSWQEENSLMHFASDFFLLLATALSHQHKSLVC